jgi:hypothetical protein
VASTSFCENEFVLPRGPPVMLPKRKGFGTSLLESTLGKARIECAPEGMTYEIELPFGEIGAAERTVLAPIGGAASHAVEFTKPRCDAQISLSGFAASRRRLAVSAWGCRFRRPRRGSGAGGAGTGAPTGRWP